MLFSVLSGVTKGMKWLSNINLVLAGMLVLYLLVVGPQPFLLREFVQSIGDYLQNFVGLSFNVNAFAGSQGEAWQASWTSFYWGWWISWAPFVGIFIARISRGRTVRQFVAGVILVPTLIGILWFSVLGGTALTVRAQRDRQPPGARRQRQRLERAVQHARLPAGHPGPDRRRDPAHRDLLHHLLRLRLPGDGHDRHRRQVNPSEAGSARSSSVITAMLAISLLFSGGLVALQTAAIIIALPFSVVMLLICWATVIAFSGSAGPTNGPAARQLVDHIGDFYGLEVEELADHGILGSSPRWMQMLRRRGAPPGPPSPRRSCPAPSRPPPRWTPSWRPRKARHASERALQVENAEADGVLIADVDDVVDHDPRASQDVQDVPDRGDATPSRW